MKQTLTDKIKQCRDGVIDNPFQGTDKKVLFVCSAGILRSATGARIYAHKYNTRTAGSHVGMALIPVTDRLMDWADEVVFVNPDNFERTKQIIDVEPYLEKIVVLEIEDQHEHMSPALLKEFEEQYEPL